MIHKREVAHAPRTRALAVQIANLRGGCVGCSDCAGCCTALLDALILPDLVLKEKKA
ncbi:MAG: hypothetical protein R3D80_04155 [Paracoccaceae bacterium]|nr:hypothetical protein [Maritimibacter sp.]